MQHRLIPKRYPKQDSPLSERQRRIYDFLHDNPVGVLTSVDPNGYPHGAVIYFYINEKFGISFLTKKGTKKYDNLVRNNNVMLVVYEPISQSVAQIVGQAYAMKDGYDLNVMAQKVFEASLKTSEGGIPPITKLQIGAYTAFEIKPAQIRMAIYERPDSGDYSRIFESIESFELEEIGS
jgi:uncharacterized pyridoxamine 5'-phosphate oxidase family protein